MVLAIGVFYTVVTIFYLPKPGFTFTSTWVVSAVDICHDPWGTCADDALPVRVGDQLEQIGALSFAQYRADFGATPLAGAAPGTVVPLTLLRDGQRLTVAWPMPTPPAMVYWLGAALLLAFLPFWLAGTLVLLFLRPRGRLWADLVASNYLLALWAVTGVNSVYQALGVTYIYVLAAWFFPSAYIPLHQEALGYPAAHARWGRRLLVLGGGLGSLLTFTHGLSLRWCSLVVAGAILVGLGLLLAHGRHRVLAIRQMARLMMAANVLGFGPGIAVYTLTGLTNGQTEFAPVTTIAVMALAIWPVGYVYAAYRHTLGALEFRANRVITQYSYAVIVSTVIGLVVAARVGGLLRPPELFASSLVLAGLVLALVWLARPFQAWMDRLAYGVVYTTDDILRVMARQLPVVSDEASLIHLLADELLPSLLVRQSALYRLTEQGPELVYARGAPADLTSDQLQQALAHLWVYQPPRSTEAWVRLVIPLDVQHRRQALWLLGRRDPDDFYSTQDIYLLRLLANQIAVALENTRLYQIVQRQAEEMARLYEAEKEISRLKSEFLARTSHELRTPLTGILGSLNLILDDPELPPADQRRFQEAAHRSATSLLRLVNDLLDMAQIEAGRLAPRLWAMDLHLLAREVFTEFEAQAKLKGLAFTVAEAPEPAPLVWADPERVRQILRNLVENALKFTAHGQVRISIQPEAPAGRVSLLVSDSGVGVAPEQQGLLFQPFVQIDGGPTRRFGGTGLGLAISRRLAELMGGTLTLHSDGLEQGSTVTLTLRLAPAAGAEAPAELTL